MKNIYAMALLCSALLLFSSFGTETTKAPSMHHTGTTFNTIVFAICNGDYVSMTLKDDYVMNGVVNGNRAMVAIKHHFTGTGTSLLTGENYTMDTEIESRGNMPVTRGAIVLREMINDDIQGDFGSRQQVLIKTHMTFNAGGRLTADQYAVSPGCQ